MMVDHRNAVHLGCPACGRFIGIAEGTYLEAAPCKCGVQTTIKVQRRAELAGQKLK